MGLIEKLCEENLLNPQLLSRDNEGSRPISGME